MLWIDPGLMTGIAMLATEHDFGQRIDPQFSARELRFLPACETIEMNCRAYSRRLAIGWERFDINDRTHKKTQAGIKDAMHIIGVCRYLTAAYGCRFLGEANQHTPDRNEQAQLKKLGWWVPGKDDAQSAAAHMLRYLVRENELTPAMRERLYTG